jgi:hypothetical protein
VITQRRDTPYSRATSLLERPSTKTAVTTNCAMPIVPPLGSGCERCPATGVNDVLNSDTATRTLPLGATGFRITQPEPSNAVSVIVCLDRHRPTM